MPDTYDEQAAIAGEAAGLRREQWPGLAHILRQTAAAEREACAVAAATFDVGDPGLHETYADGRRAAAAKIRARST